MSVMPILTLFLSTKSGLIYVVGLEVYHFVVIMVQVQLVLADSICAHVTMTQATFPSSAG